ncbi:MAG: hypothetical protein ACRDQ5_04595, partial [Sciscionella sp.]
RVPAPPRRSPPAPQPPQAPRQPPVGDWPNADTDRVEPPTSPIPALAADTITTHVRPVNQQDNDMRRPPPEPREAPAEQPTPQQLDGMIPTIQQPPARRRSLTQRLDGEHD